ncbi:AGAP012973-PA-like protein [Anopheles sinensis]|uniref:AGAP012973-PA-like protein n=1 Tax=Anopheles sinensis TaxID=74873 RepID=A0A084WPH2_ANOSI|nr:AGAP012973-PA-like protein [Anopheles sinensis]
MGRRTTGPEAAVLRMSQLFALALSAVAVTTSMTAASVRAETHNPAPATILTINQCDQQHGTPSTSTKECFCPPGYASLQQVSGEGWTRKPVPLCIGLRSPGPWEDVCVASGSNTDYYDLPPEETDLVRVFLAAHGVGECWISARRIAPRGALVRRLPGSSWNKRIEPDYKKVPLVLGEQEPLGPTDPGCAAIGGPQFGQLVIRNCSRPLHHLCLYRESSSLLTAFCSPGEYTTRYAAPQQHFCYTVRELSPDTQFWISVKPEYEKLNITTERTRQLGNELLNQFSSITRKLCPSEMLPRPSDTQIRLVKRAQNALSGSGPVYGCAVFQRKALSEMGEQTPSMHLYFDKARHKLFLTVYEGWRFWREKSKDPGFVCYTNADVALIRTVQTSQVRKFPLHRHHTHRGDDDDDDNNSDGADDKPENAEGERTMYEVRMVDSGSPGQYWCEAHLVPGLKHLVSQPVLAGRRPDGKSFFSASVDLLMDRPDVESIRLSTYEKLIKEHIKQHKSSQPELQPVFNLMKSTHVKRVDATWETADQSGSHTVRLILHVVMKRVKSWGNFPSIPELAANEIGKTHFLLN